MARSIVAASKKIIGMTLFIKFADYLEVNALSIECVVASQLSIVYSGKTRHILLC